MLVGITVNNVKPAPISAPYLAFFPSFAANTRSMNSKATISPNPSASIPAQFTNAPFPMSNNPDKSKYSGGAFPRIVPNCTPENPPAKKIKAAQNAYNRSLAMLTSPFCLIFFHKQYLSILDRHQGQ